MNFTFEIVTRRLIVVEIFGDFGTDFFSFSVFRFIFLKSEDKWRYSFSLNVDSQLVPKYFTESETAWLCLLYSRAQR